MKRESIAIFALALALSLSVSCGGGGSIARKTSKLNLVSVAVSPAMPVVQAGSTLQLNAVGTFSNGSTKNVNSLVSWSVLDPTIAAIDSAGLATGIKSGITGVEIFSAAGLANFNLAVTSGPIIAINVSPATATLSAGGQIGYTAWATTSDGSVVDVTSTVSWALSNTNIPPSEYSFSTGGNPVVLTLQATISPTTTNVLAIFSSAGMPDISGQAQLTITP